MTDNIINILTRTCNRPNYFKLCYESIKIQTGVIRHIVSCDDIDSMSYLKNYTDLIIVNVPKIPKDKFNTFPYNLYFNEMHKVIIDGYIIYLDDDDSFNNINAISLISRYTEIDSLIIWRVKFPDGNKPSDNIFARKNITSSGFPSNCFCFHYSWLKYVSWTGKKGGDSIFLHSLSKVIPKKIWINDVLTRINQETLTGGKGKGIDLSLGLDLDLDLDLGLDLEKKETEIGTTP